MKNKSIISLALSSLFFIPAYAADDSPIDNHGFYAGAGYGLLNVDGKDDFDEDDNAYNVYIGSQLNEVVSLEAGYIDFGKYGNSNLNTELDGYTLGLNLGLPINDYITLFVNGGYLWWDADINSAAGNGATDGNEFFYGAGASFAISQGWDLKVNYTRFDFNFDEDEIAILSNIDSLDSEIDYASVSVQYTF